jgi:hypothetical protein
LAIYIHTLGKKKEEDIYKRLLSFLGGFLLFYRDTQMGLKYMYILPHVILFFLVGKARTTDEYGIVMMMWWVRISAY